MPKTALLTRGGGPPTGPFTLNRRSPQAVGLAAWWPTLGNPGWADRAGLVGPATFNGGTSLVSGPERPALATDGVDGSYASIPYSTAFGNADYTISFWFYKRATTAGFVHIFGASRWGTATSAQEWSLSIGQGDTGSGDYCQHYMGNGTTATGLTSTVTYPILTWHQTVGIRRGNQIELYVDGAAAASPLAVSGSQPTGAASLKLATDDRLISSVFSNALYDDLRVYNRALSAAEVWQHYDPATRWDLYAPQRTRLWATVFVQYVYPASDVSRGSWTGEGGETTSLYTHINENPAVDSTYIQSGLGPANFDAATERLAPFTIPTSTTGWALLVRDERDPPTGAAVTLRLSLYLSDGTTLVHTEDVVLGGAVVLATVTLTPTEAALITQGEATAGLVYKLLPVAG